MAAALNLSYPDVLEYLQDRAGDFAYLSVRGLIETAAQEGERWPLIRMNIVLGKLGALPERDDAFLASHAGAVIPIAELQDMDAPRPDIEHLDAAILLTRERFIEALLEDDRATLRIAADGAELTFDFEGSPPFFGRWSDEQTDQEGGA